MADPEMTVINPGDYKLVVLLTADNFLSLRHDMTRDDLLDCLLRIRDAVLIGKGAIGNG